MADTIGRGEYSKGLKNAFGLTGRTPFALASEIVPVASVIDLDGPPYHSKRGFAHFEQINAGGAGTTAWMVLTMPAGSKDIGVLRRCSGGAGSAGSFFVTPLVLADIPALGANLITEDWDVRGVRVDNYNVAAPQVKVGTPAAAAISRKLGIVVWPASGMGYLEGPFVFSDTHWLAFVATATNASINVNIYGDVYPGG